MSRRFALYIVLLSCTGVIPSNVPLVMAQPTAEPAVEVGPNTRGDADTLAFDATKAATKAMGRPNPKGAVAEWQQLLQQRPNMAPALHFQAVLALGRIQSGTLKDPPAAIATYDTGLKKHPQLPGAIVLAAEKGKLLAQLKRLDDAETTMRPYWPRALSLYVEDRRAATTTSRPLLRGYIAVLEQQGKNDEIVTRLRGALIEAPSLLVGNVQETNDAWMYETLVTKLLNRKQTDVALSWARVRFMVSDYNRQDTADAMKLLARVWQAAEGPDSPSLRAFLEAQDDPTKANPLTAVPLPSLTPTQKAALMAYNGYLNDISNARLLAGAPTEALHNVYQAAMWGWNYPGALHYVARVVKAIDLNTRRANEFVKYLETEHADNPLTPALQQAGLLTVVPGEAEAEAAGIKALDDLKATLAQNKADAKTQAAAYSKFLAAIPPPHAKAAIRATETLAQIYIKDLHEPHKAQELYGHGWQQYQHHPDVVRLLLGTYKATGKDVVPSLISVPQLYKPSSGTQIAGAASDGGTIQPVAAANPQLPAEATTVTNTADNGPGSLRQALLNAGSNPGSQIRFNIPNTDPNFKDGVFTIVAESPFPVIKAAGTTIDGTTQTAFTGDTNKLGPEIVLRSSFGSRTRTGLRIDAPRCVVKSLVLNSPAGDAWRHGILISGPGATENVVTGCYIGVDHTGSAPLPCAFGVQLEAGATNNVIGGTAPEARNIISGNGWQVSISGTGTSGNRILGNYLCSDAAGVKAVSNCKGILITKGASRNSIGADAPGAGNLIAAGGESMGAIRIDTKGSEGNIIQGNLIGTDKTGTKVIAAGSFGIVLMNDVEQTQIGGTTPRAGNLIAGSTGAAIQCRFNRNNIVQGNYLGCDITGKTALPNSYGVSIYNAGQNTIGGKEAGAGNVIVGNTKAAIIILSDDAAFPSAGNIIQGNFIGVSTDGKTEMLNGAGISLQGNASNNIVGHAADGAGTANVIAFHKGRDILTINDKKFVPTGNLTDGNTILDGGD